MTTTLNEIYHMGRNAYDALWANARAYDRDVKLYLHWSAGHYTSVFDDYHINITGDGGLVVTTDDLSETKSHTWKRNTGSIGISMCACAFATSDDLGSEPPTAAQIEAMAQVIAVLADSLDLTIDLSRVMTHGEAADNLDGYTGAYGDDDRYGPDTTCERWDLAILANGDAWKSGGDTLRGKANWYRQYWKDNPEKCPYVA